MPITANQTDGWRLRRRLLVFTAIVIVYSTLSPVSSASFGALVAQDEIVQEQETPQPSTNDLNVFMRGASAAFVGSFQTAEVTTLKDTRDHDTVFTILHFVPVEIIHDPHSLLKTGLDFDVWRWGGTYFQTETGRRPVRPVAIANALVVGAMYFVAITTVPGYPSLEGRYILEGDDTLVRLEDDRVTPVKPNTKWAEAVALQGRAMVGPAGAKMTDRNAFIAAVQRHASK